MDLLDFAKRLVEAGALTILVLLVVAIFVGLWRRWWVPGFWYDEKAADLKASQESNAELRKSNDELRVSNATLTAEKAALLGQPIRDRRGKADG